MCGWWITDHVDAGRHVRLVDRETCVHRSGHRVQGPPTLVRQGSSDPRGIGQRGCQAAEAAWQHLGSPFWGWARRLKTLSEPGGLCRCCAAALAAAPPGSPTPPLIDTGLFAGPSWWEPVGPETRPNPAWQGSSDPRGIGQRGCQAAKAAWQHLGSPFWGWARRLKTLSEPRGLCRCCAAALAAAPPGSPTPARRRRPSDHRRPLSATPSTTLASAKAAGSEESSATPGARPIRVTVAGPPARLALGAS